jgi:hypothetical protein
MFISSEQKVNTHLVGRLNRTVLCCCSWNLFISIHSLSLSLWKAVFLFVCLIVCLLQSLYSNNEVRWSIFLSLASPHPLWNCIMSVYQILMPFYCLNPSSYFLWNVALQNNVYMWRVHILVLHNLNSSLNNFLLNSSTKLHVCSLNPRFNVIISSLWVNIMNSVEKVHRNLNLPSLTNAILSVQVDGSYQQCYTTFWSFTVIQ